MPTGDREDGAALPDDDVGVQPRLDEPHVPAAADLLPETAASGLVHVVDFGAAMRHQCAVVHEQRRDEGWDGPLLLRSGDARPPRGMALPIPLPLRLLRSVPLLLPPALVEEVLVARMFIILLLHLL